MLVDDGHGYFVKYRDDRNGTAWHGLNLNRIRYRIQCSFEERLDATIMGSRNATARFSFGFS
jgi:hypothetical protein